jgi:hypothetical protein
MSAGEPWMKQERNVAFSRFEIIKRAKTLFPNELARMLDAAAHLASKFDFA